MRNANRFEEPSYFRDRNPHTNLHHITEKKNRGTKKSAIIFIHLLLFWPDHISTSRTMWILEEWEQSRKMQLLRKQKQFLCKQMQLLWKKRKYCAKNMQLLCKRNNFYCTKNTIDVNEKKQLLCKKMHLLREKKQLLCKKNSCFAKKNNYCTKKTIDVKKKQLLCKKMHLLWEKKNCCAKTKQLLWNKYVFDETTRMFKLHFKLSFYRHIYILCTYLILRISRFLWFILSFLYQVYNGGPKIAPKNNNVK